MNIINNMSRQMSNQDSKQFIINWLQIFVKYSKDFEITINTDFPLKTLEYISKLDRYS